MPSMLQNLFRTLTWGEFAGKPPTSSPFAAETHSNFTVSTPRFQRVDGKFQLIDQVTVTAVFDGAKSWRIPEMRSWPTQLQQELLEHEQGHYNITALVARDLFIQLMKLKGSVYSTEAEGARDYRSWESIYRTNEGKVQQAYDDDTGHSQANVFVPSTNFFTPPVPTKSSTQIKWERLIANAFTTVRSPPESAPDGTPYKDELVSVLRKAGITLP